MQSTATLFMFGREFDSSREPHINQNLEQYFQRAALRRFTDYNLSDRQGLSFEVRGSAKQFI